MFEIMTFRLRSGVDVAEFLVADGRVQTEIAYQSSGLLRRTLGRDGARWLVLQIWASPGAADGGRAAFDESAVAVEFLRCVDPSTVSVDRYHGLD